MLCSPRELNIADVHEGILVLNDEPVEMGQDFKAAFGLDDAVLDIEVEPNRPDFLSVFGVAREVSAATGVPLIEPAIDLEETEEEASSIATVRIEAAEACPRYVARIIRGVDASGDSPLRVQARLTASGMRPVSAVVDATNYTMLELGQPLHGFDMDRLAGPGIVVRHATEGERITTLDDVERTLTPEDLLICDLEKPVAIGGVMGGATSEVSEATTQVLLESAYFTRTGVLRSARRLDLHSEAAHRFERGTDPEGLERAAARCAGLIAAWAGGRRRTGPRRGGIGAGASLGLDATLARLDAARLRGPHVRRRRGVRPPPTRPPGAGRPRRGRSAGLPRGHRPRGRPHRRGGADRGV